MVRVEENGQLEESRFTGESGKVGPLWGTAAGY